MADDASATPDPKADPDGIGKVLYKLALAGVGALILAQEEIEGIWRRRGPPGEGLADGAGAAPVAAAPGEKPPSAQAVRTAQHIDGTIGRALRSLSVPTRDEVEAIGRGIDALSARLDALGL